MEQVKITTEKRPKKSHTYWTDEEQQLLTTQLSWGWSIQDIAKDHQRSKDAIKCQILQRIVMDGEPMEKYPFITPDDMNVYEERQVEKEQMRIEREKAKAAKLGAKYDDTMISNRILPKDRRSTLFFKRIINTEVNNFIKATFEGHTIISDHKIEFHIKEEKKDKTMSYTFELFFPEYQLLVEEDNHSHTNLELLKDYKLITYQLTEASISKCMNNMMKFIYE